MPQIIELGWIPVKNDYEEAPATKAINDLEPKLMANPDILGYWKGVRGHGALDSRPIKGCDLATIWKSLEAAKAAKESPEFKEAAQLWGQIVETSSHYGPVQPWVDYFRLDGDDFAKVIGAQVVLLSGFYLPVDADTDAFYDTWKRLTQATPNEPSGYIAGVHGWSVGDTDHKGEGKKVFMVVSGWDSAESIKATDAVDKRSEIEEGLKHFNIQKHEHLSHGLTRIK
ncbi:uncharacterized protein CTRU02_208303 [Colletotrichum truncatum]|uniref:Uncharacterized protein n=1 Tax=Colletotrichum truncatum TaxID=5467 RepID=A0ACC3YVX5_COLTU|nr:uncharacterized protein CTRU02_07517 [Colletotrichum truncatum]KAF6791177.1 hypothetical protein CTRU02_07517 [Colletotrichum truncatum]